MDTIDLKNEIRDLREKKSFLETERKELEAELAKLEMKELALRQEYNVMGAISELQVAEKYTPDEDTAENISLTDKKFDEMNKKMEIKILSSELKSTLPLLEAEALRWESLIHKASKQAKIMEEENSNIPPNIVKSKEALETELGEFIEARILQKVNFANELEHMRRDKRQLADDLKRQRLNLASLDSELWAMKNAALRAKDALMQEDIKISKLVIEQADLREEIGRTQRDGRGWQMEAFLMESGTLNGSISPKAASEILSQWLPPSIDCSIDAIIHVLQNCQPDSSSGFISATEKKINLALFCTLCDYLCRDGLLSAR